MKLTTANIAMTKGKTDEIIFDGVLRGFGLRLRIGSGGQLLRSWLIQTRMQGRMRRMLIGSAEVLTAAQARKEATKLLAKIKLGGDPATEKRERREKDSDSLRSVIIKYLDDKAGSVKEGTMQITRYYLLGPLGKRAKKKGMQPFLKPLFAMPVDKVTRKDIASRVLHVKTTSGVPSAIGLRGALSSFFGWAMEMGLVDQNPVVGALKPERPEARSRVLSDQELAAIWKNVGDDDYGKIVKLMILCGARRNEIGGMQWSEIDLDKNIWVLPKERSKNGKPHTLPLTDLMVEIIESVPMREENDHLFAKRGFSAWALNKKALYEKLDLPAWTHHDLRRSTASRMGDLGIPPHIIEQVLNHQSGHKRGVAGVYNRSPYEREVRDAMLRWSTHIAEIIEGAGKHKIIAFERAASTP